MAGDALEKLRSSVTRGITTFSIKTSSSIEKSKIKMHIESLENDKQLLLLSVGEAAFLIWQNRENDYDSLNDLFRAVQEKKEEIEKLAEELSSIDDRDKQILGMPKDIVGSDTNEKQKDKFACPSCGAEYEVAVKFCRKCGTKMIIE